jgi:hypothetical protein
MRVSGAREASESSRTSAFFVVRSACEQPASCIARTRRPKEGATRRRSPAVDASAPRAVEDRGQIRRAVDPPRDDLEAPAEDRCRSSAAAATSGAGTPARASSAVTASSPERPLRVGESSRVKKRSRPPWVNLRIRNTPAVVSSSTRGFRPESALARVRPSESSP